VPTWCSSPTIGHDDRTGRKFLKAGAGFGGGCLLEDTRAFMARASELGANQGLTLLSEIDAINPASTSEVVNVAREHCGGLLLGRRLPSWGRPALSIPTLVTPRPCRTPASMPMLCCT
jgi:UDPglucose 6-dehydrogenase